MKKLLINISLAMLAVGGMTSCSDLLDKEVDLTFTDENIYSNYDRSRGVLANCYTYLPDAFAGYTNGQFLAASRDCMTDNALSYWNVHYYHSVLNDSYDAKNHWFSSTYWTNDLKGIRVTNDFLEKARENVIGNADKAGDDNHLYDRYKAEARFIRAILHFDMIGYFGAVPIEDHVLTQDEAATITRTPAAEALKWVADECDAIIQSGALPFRYSNENENWGRINGAAVYALKSRALLYRASPLNNPNNDQSWWQEAADAALAFISANSSSANPYRLYTSDDNDPKKNYYECFTSTPHLNPEYILSRSEWNTREIEMFNTPCGFSGNVNSTGRVNPTQNLVDSYETINGLPIDQDPTYDDQNPYANRDPRLEQTIFHQGSIWGDASQDEQRAVDVSVGGKDYQDLHGGTTTGYYSKKFVHNMSFKNPTTFINACPIFRYAEILLNAAEALNEAGKTNEAYQYVNQVRARVGMPAYAGMTQSQLRERIRNERRVELCFEDHRFFDERRWKLFEGKTAASERNLPRYQQVYNIYSVVVTPDESQVYTYRNDNTHATRAFTSPKNYLFPVPDDTYKKNPNLGQNPGWELSEKKDEAADDKKDETSGEGSGESGTEGK